MMDQRFPFALSYWTDNRASATTLKAGEHFRFDLDALNSFCLGHLPRHLVDLLRISSAVYVVDRLVSRKPQPPSRTISLRIGILEEGLWNRLDVRDALRVALEFVTGDIWDIEFEQDTHPHKWPYSFLPFPKLDSSPLICLYSGGLDSAAGLADRMNESHDRLVIPVTVWHQPRQRQFVRRQYEYLRGHCRKQWFDPRIEPLIVKVAMKWKSVAEKRNQETSQRSRSFLFAALGAITAIMHGQRAVEIFESGVGAINLPLMAGMVGWKTTKNAHPRLLELMSRFVSLVAGTDVTLSLPFLDTKKTKAEMVRQLVECGLAGLAIGSASCVHYPRPGSPHKQCGVCPGCIGRRQAMVVAGLKEPRGTYQYDFLGEADPFNRLPDERLAFLKAILLQVAQLRDIENHDRLPPAFEQHVVGTGIIQRDQSQKGVIQLLARYRDEWIRIASAARERGHAWARLLAPQRTATQGVTHASA